MASFTPRDRAEGKNRCDVHADHHSNFSFDSQHDERALLLWYISVNQLDAAALAAVVCETLDLPVVKIENDGAAAWFLAEVRADPEVLDYIIEESADGTYWEAQHGARATITFDGVLVDDGEQIPIQLLIHCRVSTSRTR